MKLVLSILATLYATTAALTVQRPQNAVGNIRLSKNPIRFPISGITPRRTQDSCLFVSTMSLSDTSSTEQADVPLNNESSSHYTSVVVGGGPAGLLAAIMLAQLSPATKSRISSHKPRIAVYERLLFSADISKSYLLGLGHRGQKALRRFDVWNEVAEASVPVVGRKDWSPGKSREEDGVVRLSSDKLVETRVLARDMLVNTLLEVIKSRYNDVIELKHGYEVDPVDFGTEGTPVTLSVSQCKPISKDAEECSVDQENISSSIITADFLIGADGAARTIANAMEKNDLQHMKELNPISRLFSNRPRFRVKRFEDDNPRVYKSIPITFPSHWASNLNYSARSTGNRAALEALPSDSKGNYCALLLLRPDDELAQTECDPNVLREFFEKEYPQFSPLVGDNVMRDVAKKGASALPGFRFAGPRLNEGGKTVILGDAIHTVKPYFGLGANTALEDVSILSDTLNSSTNLSSAVQQFSKQRAADSQALVTLSRGMDRPGKLGTVRFVLPLILDSMFHKLAPMIFDPSMFGMFQLEGVGFREIQWRKRKDRFLQALSIGSGMTLFGMVMKYTVKSLAKMMRLSNTVVSSGLIVLLILASLVRSSIGKANKEEAI